MEVLKIGENDYSSHVKKKGLEWSRNDVDSDSTTRLKNGDLRRKKLATKRKLTYTMAGMTQTELAQLDDDLSPETFSVTFLDLHGVQTRTFYCSSFSASVAFIRDGAPFYDGAKFSLIEV